MPDLEGPGVGPNECRHADPVSGCISCLVDDEPTDRNRRDHAAEVAAIIEKQNRLASKIGPQPTCQRHGRTPCDLCGASHQPMAEPEDDSTPEGQVSESSHLAFTSYPRPSTAPEDD